MAVSNKLYEQFEELLENNSKEELLNYIFNFFDSSKLKELKEFIEEEKQE